MARNGAGTYSLPEAPFVFDTVISETAVNSDLSDIANALTASIANDGQTPILANLPMSSYKHTGVTATSGASSRTEYQSTATAQDGTVLDAGYTAGTSTAFTATLSPAIAAYADKQCFRVIFNQACGATPTINFNSVGAKKMYRNVAGVATQVTTGDIPASFPALLRYDSTLDAAAGAFWVMNNTPFTGGTLTSTLVMSGAAINEAKGADIASAGTTDIGAATGNFVHITGTTTITALGTVQAGTRRVLKFDGALTLTHNATSLILPGGANITTAAGDTAIFVSEGSGNWRCVSYSKASGAAISSIFSSSFVSANQTITNAGALTIAHGLSARPTLITAELVCTSAELGYSTNDVLAIGFLPSGDGTSYGLSVVPDSTNLNVRFSSAGQRVVRKDTGVVNTITNASWVIVFRAYL